MALSDSESTLARNDINSTTSPLGPTMTMLSEVHRVSFWMKAYGSVTPKRSVLWSSCKWISQFETGKMRRHHLSGRALVTKYTDNAGRKRFAGIGRRLRKSGFPDCMDLTLLFQMSRCLAVANPVRPGSGPIPWASACGSWS